MAELHMVEAVNLALAHALANDPDVVLLGEDIGVNGGVFRSTVGLQSRFGERASSTRRWPRAPSSARPSAWRRWGSSPSRRSSSPASSIRRSTTS
jgi:pyruvate dehydrogenase E1 component beta subunit